MAKKKATKPKRTISVHRLVSSSLCGLHGKKLMQGEGDIFFSGMNRGRELDAQVRKWSEGKDELPEDLVKILPDRETIDTSKIETLSKEIEGVPFPITGRPDLRTHHKVHSELKTGKPKEWHLIQVDAYRWLEDGKEPGQVINLDDKTVIPAPMVVNDEFVRTAWKNIQEGKPTRNEQCKGHCPFKSECKLWVVDATEETRELIEIVIKKKTLEDKLNKIKKKYKEMIETETETIINELKPISEREAELRNIVIKYETMTYKVDSKKNVRVQIRKVVTLPDNYLELAPYESNQKHYKLEPKTSLKDIIGIESNENQIVVTTGWTAEQK